MPSIMLFHVALPSLSVNILKQEFFGCLSSSLSLSDLVVTQNSGLYSCELQTMSFSIVKL